jgi:ubiquinone/menaquinone biosynthesis C-methylase UbiE
MANRKIGQALDGAQGVARRDLLRQVDERQYRDLRVAPSSHAIILHRAGLQSTLWFCPAGSLDGEILVWGGRPGKRSAPMMNTEHDAAGTLARDAYSAQYASHVDSPTRQRIRREVYGDEYPEDVDPRSFITRSELRSLADALRVGPGQTFVDLGCGHGGPGLWVARETGASVVGIDLSRPAIARTAQRAEEFGVADRARFEVADLVATGLPDAAFNAAMSVDVLWSVPDKVAALREIARILKPGARFAFTNWDRDLTPPGYLPPLADHRPLLAEAGFEVERYEVQSDAERRRAYYERLVAAEDALRHEMGVEATARLMFEAKGTLGLTDGIDYLAHSRRIVVVARRRPFSTTR